MVQAGQLLKNLLVITLYSRFYYDYCMLVLGHINCIRVDITNYQYKSKKLNCTGIPKVG